MPLISAPAMPRSLPEATLDCGRWDYSGLPLKAGSVVRGRFISLDASQTRPRNICTVTTSECLCQACKCNNEHFGTREESGWWWLKFHSYLCLQINTNNTEGLCPGEWWVGWRSMGVTVPLESCPQIPALVLAQWIGHRAGSLLLQ